MIRAEEVFKIGSLTKTHGLKGEIAFRFDNDIFDRVECPYFVLDIDGIFVPFFIDEYRFKGEETALITFQDIYTEEKASRLQGLDVYFPREYMLEAEEVDSDLNYSWDYFIGFQVIDQQYGELGTITQIDTQTINTLFMVENGQGEELIVPATEDFMTEIDNENKIVRFNLPQGLIESLDE